LAVRVLPAVDLTARGAAGFGQRVLDDEPADAAAPVGGLLLAQAGSSMVEVIATTSLNAGQVIGGPPQRDDVGVGQEGALRGPGDRSQVLGRSHSLGLKHSRQRRRHYRTRVHRRKTGDPEGLHAVC
jgi:hypothetical protein